MSERLTRERILELRTIAEEGGFSTVAEDIELCDLALASLDSAAVPVVESRLSPSDAATIREALEGARGWIDGDVKFILDKIDAALSLPALAKPQTTEPGN